MFLGLVYFPDGKLRSKEWARLLTWKRVQNSILYPLPLTRTPLPPSLGSQGPPTITRDSTVFLALLLRVELVAVAFATPIGELDALPLHCIKCPDLYIGSAWALDYGEIAGRCGRKRGHGVLVSLAATDGM